MNLISVRTVWHRLPAGVCGTAFQAVCLWTGCVGKRTMPCIDTLRECFTYNDWGREKLLAHTAGLSDAEFDRPIAMGEGSLRKTLYHLWAAEFGWLNRWTPQPDGYDPECHGEPVGEIARRFRETAQRRHAFITELGEDGLTRTATYTNSKGVTSTFSFAQMMLHVCNHGVHHRAQAVNMLRQLGKPVPGPGLDYIFMKLEQAEHGDARSTTLDRATLTDYFAYGDWARAKVHAAAAPLNDAQLDRPFGMGLGTLRATLEHIQLAEQWWYENWTRGPGQLFPQADPQVSTAELTRRFDETAARRNEFLARLSDSDLARPTTATPRPGIHRTFPLGVTMLQLCGHGTQHRAQALNMLRQLGAEVPALDYVAMLRERK